MWQCHKCSKPVYFGEYNWHPLLGFRMSRSRFASNTKRVQTFWHFYQCKRARDELQISSVFAFATQQQWELMNAFLFASTSVSSQWPSSRFDGDCACMWKWLRPKLWLMHRAISPTLTALNNWRLNNCFASQLNENNRWATIGIRNACDARNVANDWTPDVMPNIKVDRIATCRVMVHYSDHNCSAMAHAWNRIKVSGPRGRQLVWTMSMSNLHIRVTIWNRRLNNSMIILVRKVKRSGVVRWTVVWCWKVRCVFIGAFKGSSTWRRTMINAPSLRWGNGTRVATRMPPTSPRRNA